MDDLFQYLIYGILIFSFLSSFFKKKEPPKQSPPPRTKQPDSVSYSDQRIKTDSVNVSQKQDEYDILHELENLFKGNVNIPKQTTQAPQRSRDYIEHEIGDENLDKVSDNRMQQKIEERRASDSKNRTDRRTIFEQSRWERKKTIVDPKIEASAKEFERVLAGPKQQRDAVSEFNRKLKNPRTVREYILFSEILGKPKALRR